MRPFLPAIARPRRRTQGENLRKQSAANRAGHVVAVRWPWHRWLLLCCLWWGLLPVAMANVADWRALSAVSAHTVLTGQNGPSLRNAFTVAQDRRGRIWVGDPTGALRLDGDLVRRYPGAEVPALGSGFTRSFHGLEDGDVLVGTDREGVLRWELAHDRFVPVALADGQRLTRISAIEPARGGGAWVAGELGLYHYDPASGVLQAVDLGHAQARSSTRVFDVLEQPDGSLWVATNPGVYRRAPGQEHFEPVRVADPQLDRRLAGRDAWELQADAQGRIWVGMIRDGVVVLEPDGQAWAPQGLDGTDDLHDGTTVRALLPVEGQMWVATDGQGLFRVQGRQARRQPVNLTEFLGGRNFHVLELIRADDGRMWAASDRGVFHFDPDPQGVIELDLSLSADHPYEQPPMVRSLLVDDRQRLWAGMFGGVVQVLDPYSGQRHLIRLPPPLDGSDVVALHQDSRGRVWAASNGVAIIDPVRLTVLGDGPLPQVPVQRYTAMTGQGQRIWLGGRQGVLELDLEGRPQRSMESAAQGLRSTLVRNLAWQAGQLWVGTGEGLHRVDLERWQAEPVAVGSPDNRAPGNRFIAALAVEGEQIWAGNAEGVSGGKANAATARLPLLAGPQDVAGLVADGRGGLWLSTRHHGLFHRDSSGQTRQFGAHAGVHPDMVVHGTAMGRMADGSLVLGTRTGVTLLHPWARASAELTPPAMQPQVVSLQLDGQALTPSRLPGDGGQLVLERTGERLMLAFSAMAPVGPGLRRYSYRLEGLDSDWIDAGSGSSDPVAFYSRLPVGDYTLLLRTTSTEFPGQQWITRIGLQVPPDWYQLGWVRVLGALVLLALVLVAMNLRLRASRRRARWLQQIVDTRTAELRQANVRLAQLAGEDALTGLMNRRRGLERLDELHAWRQRMPGQDCVVLMDLDHFKQINDRYGHLGGDAVLRAVANLIRSDLRAIDVAARYGGEELLLVLVDTPLAAGCQVIERLATRLRALRIPFDDGHISVRASFGLAASRATEPVEGWIARADAALYRAKDAGRDRLCVEEGSAAASSLPIPPGD